MHDNRVLVAFGFFDHESAHFRGLRDTYAKEGWTMDDVHTNAKGAVPKFKELYRKWKEKRANADAVLVMFPGHHMVPFAWLLTRFPRKRVIFDAFISLYDTKIQDRKYFSKYSWHAWALWLIDWLSCLLADEILIDTEAHKKYFADTFYVNPKKIRVMYLEPRYDLIVKHRPRDPPRTDYDVFFYGSYIPLQGIEHILDAAAVIQTQDPSIHFTLVGGGQTEAEMRERAKTLQLKNVTFVSTMPFADLMKRMAEADLALGIFGLTDKAARVIPHKVVDAVAAEVPLITMDSPAIREKYANHPKVTLCPPGDGKALAECILRERKSGTMSK